MSDQFWMYFFGFLALALQTAVQEWRQITRNKVAVEAVEKSVELGKANTDLGTATAESIKKLGGDSSNLRAAIEQAKETVKNV